MSKKYTDPSVASASPLTGAEQWGVARAGADKYQTNDMIAAYLVATGKLGLIARYHASGNITMTTGDHVIDFNTSDYDPLSTVTTGAAWHFTAPATGWYTFSLENFLVDPNSAGFSVDDSFSVNPYKNGTWLSGFPSVAYWDVGDAVVTHNDYTFLTGSQTVALTAGDTFTLHFNNSTSGTRKVSLLAAIVITRVA